ncbi:putative cyclic nucleotide-gated ion channel 13 [Citrus sinensis]|uniref:putative cyclic nucleotide-gated ion channel 13 n=1 Tax=Citrus sinensis TaxID=2711 RepID=UPI0022793E86|nr:putative cyclic nucleotide-gated ion channel 13 [Citrus sinensis]
MTFFVLQYLLRVIRTYFLFTDAIEVSGVIADATWGIFAFYVLLYLQSGHDLETSDDVGENIFAIWMTIYGVVLFVFLIGRMQSETTRAHKINQKLRQIKHWKHFKDISTFVRAKIREAKRENLLLKHDIHIDSLVSDLPDDTAKQVKLHFGRNLLGQMQKFENWEDYSLDHLCGCLKPVFFSERTTIISEGESIHEMLFVLEGQISIYSKFKLIGLKRQEDGNYCGEEIIDWAENQSSSHGHLPISTRTIIAHTNIEGFTLKADDLKQGVALHRRFDQLVRSVQSSWRSKKSKQMQMKRRQSRSHE